MGLLGGLGNALLGDDSGFDAATGAVRQNRALLDAIQNPEYSQFSPELYSSESANYDLIKDNPLLKSAQLSALQKMAGLADNGLSDVDQAGYEKARELGGQVQRAGNEAAMQNAQARGVGGSGLEFAMREAANQSGAQQAQAAGLTQAADSARQRALYQQAYGNQLNQMQQADYQKSAANSGIINQFNQLNTQNRNQTANANQDLRNTAFQYNQNLKDKNFQNQMSKATGQMQSNQQLADISMARSAQNQASNNALLGAAAGAGGAYLARK